MSTNTTHIVKHLAVITASLLLLSVPSQAKLSLKDKGEDKVKTGYNTMPIPVIGWSDVLGFQYGLKITVFDYGDGKEFPNYWHKLSLSATRFTKGQYDLSATFYSEKLIPSIRLNASFDYSHNPLSPFYGFNGSVTTVDRSLDRRDGDAYYSIDKGVLKSSLTFQGHIRRDLIWGAGINYARYRVAPVKAKWGYREDFSLYDDYISSGVILPEEASGGHVLEFLGGLVYDTRDALSMPSRGTWAELYLNVNPGLVGHTGLYSQLCAHVRRYVTIPPGGRVTLAFHAASQVTLCGDLPFYLLQNIACLSMTNSVTEGLGGKNTIRGLLPNRLLGRGYAWGNAEARVKLFGFEAFNQAFLLLANPFVDCGAVIQPYRLEQSRYQEAKRLHSSAGIGLKIVMNKNNVTSLEIAWPFDKNDGGFRFMAGSKFAF